MRSFSIVVMLETGQIPFQISISPERHMIEMFAPDSADQPFYEWVREWHVMNGLYFIDLEDSKICLPATEFEQRVII